MNYQAMVPMLAVSDIQQSIRFYQRALGFQIVSEVSKITEWNWVVLRKSAARGPIRIMLAGTEHGPCLPQAPHQFAAIQYYYIEDVDSFHSSLIQRGYQPGKLENTFYGMREFTIKDPDGHWLSFGQELEDTLPSN